MRETTRLLMAHIPVELANCVEQFLGAPADASGKYIDYEFDGKLEHEEYLRAVSGGHSELTEAGIRRNASGEICFKNLDILLKAAALSSNADLVRRAICLGATGLDGAILVAAAHEADNEVFNILVEAGGYPDSGMGHAAGHGNMRIIEHLHALGGVSYNAVLAHACSRSHLRAMQWALNKGASSWDYALAHAAGSANKMMSIVCLRNGANIEIGLENACNMGHPEHMKLARFFVSRGARDFNAAMAQACEGGSQAPIDYLLECGATECWHCGLSMDTHRNMHPID